MEGWKTKVAGGLSIGVGLGGFALGFLGFQGLDFTAAMGFVTAGLVAFGLGHKVDKLKQALEALRKG